MPWYERLKTAREAKGFTNKAAFAKRIGVSGATITEWERGKTVSPSAASVQRICEVLAITPEWLLDGGGEVERQFKYAGPSAVIADVVAVLETLPEHELSQVAAMIQAFASKRPS